MMKTLSFGAMHIVVAFVVVGTLTGDWMVGGVVALVEPCVNTVAYHFHERVWMRRGKAQPLNLRERNHGPRWSHAH